jgi:hypothetical protein
MWQRCRGHRRSTILRDVSFRAGSKIMGGRAVRSGTLQLMGLALNVVEVALIFLFAYPPQDERKVLFIRLSRFAVLLVFCGFLLQFVRALLEKA